MNRTSIEWTDLSINFIRARDKNGHVGHYCEKVSPGCKNCYASRLQPRFGMPTFPEQRANMPDVFLDEKVLLGLLKRRKPAKIFPCDMTDMFGDWVPDEWLDKFFAVAALTPHLTYQVLTKRADRMARYFGDVPYRQEMLGIWAELWSGKDRFVYGSDETTGTGDDILPRWPLPFPNVWIGVSVEDKARKDRIDTLRRIPAAVRWLSLEPLLEDLGALDLRGIHWVVVGGESGPGARPMHPDWVGEIRDQCVAAGVPFFFKQWGAWLNYSDLWKEDALDDVASGERYVDTVTMQRSGLTINGIEFGWAANNRLGSLPFYRVGKKLAGRMLDGRTWDQFPEPGGPRE